MIDNKLAYWSSTEEEFLNKKKMTREIEKKITFSDGDIDIIKKDIFPEGTHEQKELFIKQCERTGLDPLTRQIYAMIIKGKMSVQTSIDGFRVIAERSGDYAGQDEPVFSYDKNNKLICAKVKIFRFRGDNRYQAAVGVAYWDEYFQADKYMWKKMPHTMLSKVAEALALRKAYPLDLSGIYTSDEMAQSDNPQSNIQKLANIADADMKETLRKANEDIFERLKEGLELCQSEEEMKKFSEINKKDFSKLEKWESDLYEELKELYKEMRESFEDDEFVEVE